MTMSDVPPFVYNNDSINEDWTVSSNLSTVFMAIQNTAKKESFSMTIQSCRHLSPQQRQRPTSFSSSQYGNTMVCYDCNSWCCTLGLQSMVLYSLPELNDAINVVVLGGLAGDQITLIPEWVRKLCGRLHGWISLRKTHIEDCRVSIVLYGFPPNVGQWGGLCFSTCPICWRSF